MCYYYCVTAPSVDVLIEQEEVKELAVDESTIFLQTAVVVPSQSIEKSENHRATSLFLDTVTRSDRRQIWTTQSKHRVSIYYIISTQQLLQVAAERALKGSTC